MPRLTEFEEKRVGRARQSAGQALIEHLDLDAHSLAEIVGSAPDAIREAMCVAAEFGEMHANAIREAEAEEEPGFCANAVCRSWVQSEGEVEIEHEGLVEIRQTGRKSFCEHGGPFACGCLFRMKEAPPNRLDGETCGPIPEWAEAVRMLRRLGELEPDEFGKYNGTDMALHANVRIVWWSLVELLVETGRIEREWIETGRVDTGEESRNANALLLGDGSGQKDGPGSCAEATGRRRRNGGP